VTPIIQSVRLDLIPLSPATIRAALEGDHRRMEQLLGVSVPASWEVRREYLELRLRQLEANPTLQPWLIRGISLRDEGLLIGDIGFHYEPVAPSAPAPKSVEFGYAVIEGYRRRGFATEASEALTQWACERHDVHRFLLSISPKNHASRALAAKMGFQKVGFKIDEQDGPEDIFEKIV
jgi:RimJ/RimL family protein N-acetyltransferase